MSAEDLARLFGLGGGPAKDPRTAEQRVAFIRRVSSMVKTRDEFTKSGVLLLLAVRDMAMATREPTDDEIKLWLSAIEGMRVAAVKP